MTSYIAWLRRKIGHQKTIIVYASVVLCNAQGQVLLQRRTDFDVWGLPGGILEPEESILDCARRELREETGLEAGALHLVGVYSEPQYDTVYPNGDQVQQFTLCFQGDLSGGEMAVDGTENSAQAFFAPEDIPWTEMPDFYVAMVRDALAGRQGVFAPPYAGDRLADLIGQVRSFVGRDVIVAGGAVAVIVDARQRLLVVKRTDDGEWALPGGFTHLGENAAHTVIREIQEETGLHILPERILGISSPARPWAYPNGDQTQVVGVIFLARPAGGPGASSNVPRPDMQETSQVSWVTVDEFLALDVHPLWRALHHTVAEHLEKDAPRSPFIV